MIMQLPPHDPADVAARDEAAATHERTGQALGRTELRLAARILRNLWGSTAARLVIREDVDEHEDTDIDALLLFDTNGELLWYSDNYASDYPGATDLDRTMSREAVGMIEGHLHSAYDAMNGSGQGLSVTEDDHFGFGWNLLELDIDAALNA